MSTPIASDAESFAEDAYNPQPVSYGNSLRGRYVIHDACEFQSEEVLRDLIFVPRSASDSSEDDSSSSSDEDEDEVQPQQQQNQQHPQPQPQQEEPLPSAANQTSEKNDACSSDDDSSGTDGEHDTAAAAAAAMGHAPPMQSTPVASITLKEEGKEDGNPLLSPDRKMSDPPPTTDSPVRVVSVADVQNEVNGMDVDKEATQTSEASIETIQNVKVDDISPIKLDKSGDIPTDVSNNLEILKTKLGMNESPDTPLAIHSPTDKQIQAHETDGLSIPDTPIITNGNGSCTISNIIEKKSPEETKPKKVSYYCPYDLNLRDEDENTPLHVAIHSRKLGHMRLLLEAGASPNRKCDGSSPLHTAISIGAIKQNKGFSFSAVQVLERYDTDFSMRDDGLQTPLYLSAVCNLPSIAGIILENEVGLQTLNMKSDRSGGRPLHAAAKFDVSRGSINNAMGVGGISGGSANGMNAVGGGSSKAILTQMLLNTPGVEVDSLNNFGRTPLHIAASRGNWTVASLLLKAGANPAITDKRGFTPGGLAYKRGMPVPNDLKPNLGSPGSGVPPSLHISTAIPPTRDLMIDPEGQTILICHELCGQHLTCPPITRDDMIHSEPPPENVRRLTVLLNEDTGILKCAEFDSTKWEPEGRRAAITDVLKVHDYNYIQKVSRVCSQLPDHPRALATLDPDTAVSRWSFEGAMRAAGSVCEAVDRIMAGDFRNAFCAVRPPGHHAGPRGIVRCPNDPEGSHGFCLLNNVAIGAAYARSLYRNDGIKKVAIIDFDVHHGNGTEEIVRQLVPNTEQAKIQLPFASGSFETSTYRPWLDENDVDNVFFASCHGYGPSDIRFADHMEPHQGGWFYPASGKSMVTESVRSPSAIEHPNQTDFLYSDTWTRMGEESKINCCKIVNVGLHLPRPGDIPGMQRVEVRDAYRKNILPNLLEFNPDMIFISAGFDAHKKDTMNFGYVGMVEEDYEWLTEQFVKVANTCCSGRIVSVLEGGYRVHGGIVSPFARSVASHVRGLVDGGNSRELYDKEEAEWESQFERDMVEEREKRRQLRIERLNRPFIGMERRRPHPGQVDMEAIMKEPLSNTGGGQEADNTDCGDEGGPARKRRRNQVDYKELFEQMKKEGLAG